MNLGEIRTRIFNQIDWSPTTSAEAVTRTNGFINRAYEQLCLEAPFLFFESEVKLATKPDVVSKDTIKGVAVIPGATPVLPGTEHYDRLVFGNDIAAPTQRYLDEINGATAAPATLPIGATTTQKQNESVDSYRGSPWVFRWNLFGTDANWQAFVDAGGVVPPIDGSWDGRSIDLQATDGSWHENRVREIWVERTTVGGAYKYTYVVALWEPFPMEQFDVTTAMFKYRIYTEEYYFPDDVIKTHSLVLKDDQRSYPLDVLLQEEAEQFSLTDHFEMASGTPSVAYRRAHFQLPAPNTAPLTSLFNWASPKLWRGPEPAGAFSYVVTYCIGQRDLYYRNPGPGMFDESYTNTLLQNGQFAPSADPTAPGPAPGSSVYPNAVASNRFREPLWESAPSPVSSKVEVKLSGETSGATLAVTLQVPNITFMLGMLGGGSYWRSAVGAADDFSQAFGDHSGVRVRIYRRRWTQDWTGYNLLNNNTFKGAHYTSLVGGANVPTGHIEVSDAYYLLGEMQVTHSNRGIFIDDGQVTPDYNRRLRDVHGYQSMGLYPVPSKRFEFKIRCLRRPPKLVDDQDAPLVHAEACNLLVDLAASYWYEAQGAMGSSNRMRERYDRALFDLKKRYGNLQSQANPHLKRLSRARAGFRRTRPLRKWWTLP